MAGVAIERGHALSRGDEAEAMEDGAVDGGIEDLAEIAVGYREPDVAVGPRSGAEGLLTSGAPTGGDSGPAWRSLDDGQQLSGRDPLAPSDDRIVNPEVWEPQLDQSSDSPVN